jgi:acyl-CoA synthetase (AMP-forming)/AMP-acid ligase II
MMPMFHTAQLNAFCTPAVLVGATIHVMRGFDPVALLDLVERERITQVFGLPMMYRAMLEHPSFAGRDLSSLKRAVYAMAPMPDALIRACLDGFGCDFALLFGQTEMSPCTTLFRPEHQLTHIGAVGTPLVGVQVAIMGPDGELLPASRARSSTAARRR